MKLVQDVVETATEFEKAAAQQKMHPHAGPGPDPAVEAFDRFNDMLDAKWIREKKARREAARTERDILWKLKKAFGDELRKMVNAGTERLARITAPFASAARALERQPEMLRIEPHREPLLDPAIARVAFPRARTEIDAILAALQPPAEEALRRFRIKAEEEAQLLDPSGQIAARWRAELGAGDPLFKLRDRANEALRLLDQLEPDLAAFAAQVAEDATWQPAAAGDGLPHVLASFRHDTVLGPGDLARILEKAHAPRSERLRAAFVAHVPHTVPTVADILDGMAPAEAALLVSEAFERAVVFDALQDMGYREAQPVQAIASLASISQAIIESLAPGAVALTGEDADRLLHALVLGSECDSWASRVCRRDTWGALEPGLLVPALGAEPARAQAYRELVNRFEASALQTIGFSGREARGFAHHHLPVLARLRAAIGVPANGPAMEAWHAFLSRRRALRAEVLGLASDFWRPLLQQLIDLPKPNEREQAPTMRAAFEPFATMDGNRKALVLGELAAIRKKADAGSRFGLVSLADREQSLQPHFQGWPELLARLQELLASSAEEQARYFAPPPPLPDLGAFAELTDGFGGSRVRDNQIDRDIVPLLVDGRFDEAENEVRIWLERAPQSALRDLLLATRWQSMSLRGWDSVDRWLEIPKATAIGLDFSAYSTGEVRAPGDAIPFEAGHYEDWRDFSFSAQSPESLRDLCRSLDHPWPGYLADAAPAVPIVGLAPAILALHAFEREARYDWSAELLRYHRAMRRLAKTWCYVAVNQLVARMLREQGLRRSVPVIVGDHDFGSFPPVPHFPS
jgi:hypothetical protein